MMYNVYARSTLLYILGLRFRVYCLVVWKLQGGNAVFYSILECVTRDFNRHGLIVMQLIGRRNSWGKKTECMGVLSVYRYDFSHE